MYAALSLLLLWPLISHAVIPSPCAKNTTQTPAICCPVALKQTNPCGYPHRGRCALAAWKRSANSYAPDYLVNDIRMNWPSRVFQYTCKCTGKFWGVACEGCRFGFEGDQCQYKVVSIRRNVLTYTPTEKQQLLTVLDTARNVDSGFVRPIRLGDKNYVDFTPTSISENMIYTHYFATAYPIPVEDNTCRSLNFNHNTGTFILWHRYVILWWERNLRDLAKERFGWNNFTFPYWDYTNKNVCEVCTPDLVCELGKQSDSYQISKACKPISTWKIYCMGENPPGRSESCNYCDTIPGQRRLQRTFYPSKNVKSQLISDDEFRYNLAAPTFNEDSTKWVCGGFAEFIEGGCPCLTRKASHALMHNLPHNIFGGDMRNPVGSTNDPLFFLHHTQLDRLLHRWILKVKPDPKKFKVIDMKPQICRDCNLVGFLPTVTGADMMRDLADLGIGYDNLNFGPLKEEVPLAKSAADFEAKVCKKQKTTDLRETSVLKELIMDMKVNQDLKD